MADDEYRMPITGAIARGSHPGALGNPIVSFKLLWLTVLTLVVKHQTRAEVGSRLSRVRITSLEQSAADRVRSAAEHLVRLCSRLCPDLDSIGPLLGRSLIAVSQGPRWANPD